MGGGTPDRPMTLRALLAPDCGEGVGLGHLERMLALADALRTHSSVSLILPEGDAVLHRRVEDRGHTAVAVPGETATRVQAAITAPDRSTSWCSTDTCSMQRCRPVCASARHSQWSMTSAFPPPATSPSIRHRAASVFGPRERLRSWAALTMRSCARRSRRRARQC